MTINTWRNKILNVCKYCKYFGKKLRNSSHCRCWKHHCSIYEAKCSKTESIREKVASGARK